MNTATRTFAYRSEGVQKLGSITMTRQAIWIALLVVILFMSAFSIVYVKDLNRRLFIQQQQLQIQYRLENERWGKLLLEQSTLNTQARIQHIAQTDLNMLLPAAATVHLVDGG